MKPLQLLYDRRFHPGAVEIPGNGKLKSILEHKRLLSVLQLPRGGLLVQLADQSLQTFLQFLRDQRLKDIIHHAQGQRRARIFKIRIAAENEDFHIRKQLFRFPDQLQAVHQRHLHIRKKDIRSVRFLQLH